MKINSTEHRKIPAQYEEPMKVFIDTIESSLQKGEQISPVALLFKDSEIIVQMAGEFDGLQSKNSFADAIRAAASQQEADCVVFISEAWTLPSEWSTKEKYEELKRMNIEVADAPFKISCVIITMETREGQWTGRAIIDDGWDGAQQVRRLEQLEWNFSPDLHGRFSHFLPELPATQEQQDNFINLLRKKFVEKGLDPEFEFASGASLMGHATKTIARVAASRLTEEAAENLVAGLAAFSAAAKEKGIKTPLK